MKHQGSQLTVCTCMLQHTDIAKLGCISPARCWAPAASMLLSNLSTGHRTVEDCTVGSTRYYSLLVTSPNWLNSVSLAGSTYYVVTALQNRRTSRRIPLKFCSGMLHLLRKYLSLRILGTDSWSFTSVSDA